MARDQTIENLKTKLTEQQLLENDYSKVNFIIDSLPIEIICKTHNTESYFLTPDDHKNGIGCPLCNL